MTEIEGSLFWTSLLCGYLIKSIQKVYKIQVHNLATAGQTAELQKANFQPEPTASIELLKMLAHKHPQLVCAYPDCLDLPWSML